MPDQRTIWKRRAVLMAAVGLLIAVPLTIVVRGGDDEQASTPAEPELPQVGAVQFDRDLGVELRLPNGWKRKREGKALAFRSPDDSVLIAISAPGPAEDVEPIHTSAIAAIKSQYRAVEIVERSKSKKLGDRPAVIAAISARHPKERSPIRILVATVKGEKLAYLAEVFASGTAALVEGQALLNNLRLEG